MILLHNLQKLNFSESDPCYDVIVNQMKINDNLKNYRLKLIINKINESTITTEDLSHNLEQNVQLFKKLYEYGSDYISSWDFSIIIKLRSILYKRLSRNDTFKQFSSTYTAQDLVRIYDNRKETFGQLATKERFKWYIKLTKIIIQEQNEGNEFALAHERQTRTVMTVLLRAKIRKAKMNKEHAQEEEPEEEEPEEEEPEKKEKSSSLLKGLNSPSSSSEESDDAESSSSSTETFISM